MGVIGEESLSVVAACTEGNIELLRELLKQECNPNESDSRGRTALHLAAARGRDDILNVLLTSGVDTSATDAFGNTALHYCGHVETIQCLMDNGADIRARYCTVAIFPDCQIIRIMSWHEEPRKLNLQVAAQLIGYVRH